MVRIVTILMEEQKSSAIRILYKKVTRVMILGGHLRSTVGVGIRLKEELKSKRLKIPGDEVRYEMTHGR